MVIQTKIGEIFNVARGGSPRPIDNFITDGEGYNWIMIGDTIEGNKYIKSTKKKILKEGLKKSRMVYPGDFLLTNSMSFGKPYILEIEGCIHDGWLVLSPIVDNIDKDFFYYLLGSNEIKLKLSSKAAGAVVKNLNAEIVRNLEIPLPPLETQKAIAEKLDKADALRKKDQELLKQYDELAQAIFIDMFGDPVQNEKGWEMVFLESLCTDIVDCPHSTPKKVEYVTEYPCIRTSEIKNGSIFWKSMQYLDEDNYNIRIKRLKPRMNDIVYSREGSYGDAVLLPKEFNFSLGQRTMLFRINELICNPIFFHRMIISDFVYRQAKRKNSGSTVGHVNVKDIKKFYLYNPSLELQNQFAEKIKNIEAQKAIVKQQAEESENLFQVLLQQSFNFN
ncbi:restriction endonuclease subunit S [Empedobacter falsenii]